jgi:hypothetical protein
VGVQKTKERESERVESVHWGSVGKVGWFGICAFKDWERVN